MKKIKAYILLIAAAIILITNLVSFTVSPTVKAIDQNSTYDASWGNHATANMKNFAYPFAYCTWAWGSTAVSGWNVNLITGKISPKTISENKWYRAISWWFKVSAPVEKAITGKLGDGNIKCDENDSAIVGKTIDAVNGVEGMSVSGKDFICNKFDNYVSGGLLGRGNMNSECGLVYGNEKDDNNYYYDNKTTDEKQNYLRQLLGDYVFGPSSLEYYYLVYDAFTTACTGGKSSGNSGKYVIKEKDSNNEIVEVWYTGQNKPGPNDEVVYYGADAYAKSMSCQNMADYLHGNWGEGELALEAYAKYLKDSGTTDPGGSSGSDDTGDKAEDTCQSAGGAGSLGWIACPILDWIQEATEDVYANYVEPSLVVNKGLFDFNGDTGTRKAWSTFQSFANILFIILFLVIIFSQLTGVGIDNYGIKKLLPKLIVVAILVNLSYLICVICADLSNILGSALKSMFDSLDVGGSVTVNKTSFGDGAGATVITAVALVAAVFTLGVSVWQNPGILLTLLVGALGVLIAIFFLFILLAARKAAIVVLTVLSPLAFVCYMLPNTKKLFDRWLKFWEAMLLLYPICGLLIGGGDFVSRLMLVVLSDGKGNANSDFFGYFSAMLIGIIPIFFIPTVVKSSFAAFGAIGSKITGFGKTAQGWTTGKIRNSEGYKNAQKMGLDRKTRKQAGLNKQGDPTRLGRAQNRFARTKFGRLIGADTRLGAKTAAAKKNIATQEEADATLMQTLATADMASAADIVAIDGAGNALTGKDGKPVSLFKGRNRENYYAGEFLKAAQSGDRKKMNSALAAAKSAGVKDGDIAKMVRHAENSGALNSMDANIKSAWLQSQATTNSAFAKDVELQHWAAGGGRATLGDYGDYASANMDATDLDKKALGGASAESIAGLIKANRVSSGLAEQVMSDSSINLSPEKSIMLGAVKDGKINKGAISSAQALKEDAVSLSGGGAAGNNTIHANPNNANPNQPPTSEETASLKQYVDKWTAPPAERVTIDQQKTNKVPVKVTGGSSATTRTAPGATRGGPGAAAENQVFDVRAMSDETLLDMATNPNAADNDPTRVAAELEWHRRTNPNNHGGENFENGSGI